MFKNIRICFTSNSFTVSNNQGSKTVESGHPDYVQLVDWFKAEDEQAFENYLNALKNKVSKYTNRGFTVTEGVVFINNEPLPSVLSNRLVSLADQDLPSTYLENYWKNLKDNTSRSSSECHLAFMERNNCPIDPQGFCIGYKAVDSNFKDKYTGKVDNSPGQTVTKNRRDVSDDRRNACDVGLHVGGIDYVRSFGSQTYGDKVIEVLYSPADVVSVPNDANENKIRVCSYKVLREVPWDEVVKIQPETEPAYYNPSFEDEDDDNYEDSCENCGYYDCGCDEEE